jgi:DNA helicase HerA-like ATPase
MSETFIQHIQNGYKPGPNSIFLGCAMQNGQAIPDAKVFLPLKTFNRHGLIAGATGTGKTKTLQLLAEQLSAAGVPTLLMDIKGDLSGIAAVGSTNKIIEERCKQLNISFEPTSYPVEFLSLSNDKGVRLRATVSEFGPVLLSKILGLNDTQGGTVSMLFKYCDDLNLPLLDLKDFIKVLQFAAKEGKQELQQTYGNISTSSIGTIIRKAIELQQQGADIFFGEPSFDVNDLMRTNAEGKGMVNILRVTDIQDKPKLFSTFMLCLLAELYANLPESGDLDKPKLCLFIDEAHLIFNEAGNALLNQIETIVKLIRSKGVGIFFVTQTPTDIPASVLAQLGLKVQHALRAFTAKDRKAIKQTAENFPLSNFYKTDEIITHLGMGEALVTGLNEKGVPTPLAATLLRPPQSRMNVLTDDELNSICSKSNLVAKYNISIDSHSAFEILSAKLENATDSKANAEKAKPLKANTTPAKKETTALDDILKSPAARQVARTAAQVITRSLLGALGLNTGSTRKKKSGWF